MWRNRWHKSEFKPALKRLKVIGKGETEAIWPVSMEASPGSRHPSSDGHLAHGVAKIGDTVNQ